MLAKPLTCDRSSFLLQLEKPKSPTSEQVKGPSRVGSWYSNSQDSCPQAWLPPSTSLLPSEITRVSYLAHFIVGKTRLPICLASGQAWRTSLFRRPHSRGASSGPSPSSMVNGPLESSKNWVPWNLKAILETLDPMVCVGTLNLGHFTTPIHLRKPPDS